MRILVFGADGFVGNAIVREFFLNKHEVFCLGSLNAENLNNVPNFYKIDIRNFESFGELEKLKKIDVIVHAAGLAHQFGKTDSKEFWDINVKGTKNAALLAAKINVKHFILISSAAVYGKKTFNKTDSGNIKNKDFIDENQICEPGSIYGQSKLEAEKAAREICEGKNISLTILRLATVIGENDRGNVSRLIKAIDNNRFLWIGDGKNSKTLVYKGDVGKACQAVLLKRHSRTEIFNVCAEPIRMSEIVRQISKSVDKRTPKLSIPKKILNYLFTVNKKIFHLKKIDKYAETTAKWLSDEVFSGEKIKSAYGFYAETSIIEAIEREVRFFKNQK